MKIVFRTDASLQIGSGHVMRCLTLADELRQRGGEARFVCREHPGNLIGLIEGKGYPVVRLPQSEVEYTATPDDVAHAAWLGASWQQDAADTCDALGEIRTDWLIIDHYAIDCSWEERLRPHVGKIMVIDDLADRPHDCDLLLDQNLFENMERRYDKLVSGDCIKLLGPRYALLRPEFTMARRTLRKHDGIVRHILVFFGGSDPTNETGKTLEAILMLDRPDIVVDVVVGGINPHKESIRSLCLKLPNASYHCQVDNMAELMSAADLAVGAGGATSWERCCLGTPAIVITMAINQEALTDALRDAGAIFYVGRNFDIAAEALAEELRLFIDNPALLEEMSASARRLVDGRGTERVVNHVRKKYRISIVSESASWIIPFVEQLKNVLESEEHRVTTVCLVEEIPEGDFVFYLGCGQLASKEVLGRNLHNIVVHESALPHGKGWSPLTWQILEGKSEIPVTLFEAEESVDSGQIYLQDIMKFDGHELIDELRKMQGHKTVELCLNFIRNFSSVVASAKPQIGDATFFKKRVPADSRIDPEKSITEQFNLFRVVDNIRYPAYFDHNGYRYLLKIEKATMPEAE